MFCHNCGDYTRNIICNQCDAQLTGQLRSQNYTYSWWKNDHETQVKGGHSDPAKWGEAKK